MADDQRLWQDVARHRLTVVPEIDDDGVRWLAGEPGPMLHYVDGDIGCVDLLMDVCGTGETPEDAVRAVLAKLGEHSS